MAIAVESFWRRLRYTRMRDVLRCRFDGQLDWQRVIDEAELPDEIANSLSHIVRKTRLWKCERCEVASELVSHFQDGFETGLSSEDLLANFGDTKLSAQLIRRSKRRNRPLVWQAWWWASRSLVALFAAYGLMALFLAFDRPTISTDFLAVVNRPYVAMPEIERAWPHYLVALEWLKTNIEESNEHPPEMLSVDRWLNGPIEDKTQLLDEYPELDDDQCKIVEEWLDQRAEFLALVRKATDYQRLGLASGNYSERYRQLFGMQSPEIDADVKDSFSNSMFNTLLPHVQTMSSISRALRADLHRSAKKDDGAEVLADLKAMIGVARHSGDGAWLVSGLVKCNLLTYAIESLEIVLSVQPYLLEDDQLVELAHLLSAESLDAGNYVEGEKSSFDDFVQRLYSDDGKGDGYLTAEGIRLLDRNFKPLLGIDGSLDDPHFTEWQYFAAAPASYLVAASRREILAKCDEMWARMQTAAERPLWDPLPEEETANGQIHQISQIEKYRYAPLMMYLPAYQAAATTFERMKGRREGALIGIALELYRRKYGNWPESLEQLSPQWIPKVPIDRINGGPLGYRAWSEGVVIYSFGVDSDDDHGKIPSLCHGDAKQYQVRSPSAETSANEDGDWVIWSTVQSDAK